MQVNNVKHLQLFQRCFAFQINLRYLEEEFDKMYKNLNTSKKEKVRMHQQQKKNKIRNKQERGNIYLKRICFLFYEGCQMKYNEEEKDKMLADIENRIMNESSYSEEDVLFF